MRVALQVEVRRRHEEQQLVVAVVLQQQLVEQVDRGFTAVSLRVTHSRLRYTAVVVVQLQEHLPSEQTNVVGGQHVAGGVYESRPSIPTHRWPR